MKLKEKITTKVNDLRILKKQIKKTQAESKSTKNCNCVKGKEKIFNKYRKNI